MRHRIWTRDSIATGLPVWETDYLTTACRILAKLLAAGYYAFLQSIPT